MLCNFSCFHFILLRSVPSKYIENTTIHPQTIKLTRKCPMTQYIQSGREFLHKVVNQYTLPSSCLRPEITIKNTSLSWSTTHWDERVNYNNLCMLLNAIFLMTNLSPLWTHFMNNRHNKKLWMKYHQIHESELCVLRYINPFVFQDNEIIMIFNIEKIIPSTSLLFHCYKG